MTRLILAGPGSWADTYTKFVEPPKVECQHSVECIGTKQRPITVGAGGFQAVEALQAGRVTEHLQGLIRR